VGVLFVLVQGLGADVGRRVTILSVLVVVVMGCPVFVVTLCGPISVARRGCFRGCEVFAGDLFLLYGDIIYLTSGFLEG